MAKNENTTTTCNSNRQRFEHLLIKALKSRGNMLVLAKCAQTLQLNVVEKRAQTLVATEGVITDIDRGRALWNLLQEAIERLRPTGDEPKSAPTWRLYAIAEGIYIRGQSTKMLAEELNISQRTFYRERRAAVEALVLVVWQIESHYKI